MVRCLSVSPVDEVPVVDSLVYVSPLVLSNDDLFRTQITLALACGRSRSALKKKHREHICFLFEALKLESDRRGQPSPEWPYRA